MCYFLPPLNPASHIHCGAVKYFMFIEKATDLKMK